MKDRNRKTGNKEARKRKGSGKKRLAAGDDSRKNSANTGIYLI